MIGFLHMGWVMSKRSIFCGFLPKTQKNIGSIEEILEKTLDKLTKVVYMGK